MGSITTATDLGSRDSKDYKENIRTRAEEGQKDKETCCVLISTLDNQHPKPG
jgi:hypothetical protein